VPVSTTMKHMPNKPVVTLRGAHSSIIDQTSRVLQSAYL